MPHVEVVKERGMVTASIYLALKSSHYAVVIGVLVWSCLVKLVKSSSETLVQTDSASAGHGHQNEHINLSTIFVYSSPIFYL
jgi:hypothetical protein